MPSAPSIVAGSSSAGRGERCFVSRSARRPTDDNLAVIKSPMVGTFYASANPESPPFVKVGDHVGPETVVCIIEAMKVFNEIPAEVSGQVVAVLVETGAAGRIRPAAVQDRHAEVTASAVQSAESRLLRSALANRY